ncbi:killer cell lectin-like receptor subfamily B member 1 [Hypanus sabinus]|uniref:killer cell lectin-like receptor subfamily B member 1 n=1 Tax=Hypanus sabinus TaxID=79690 RepID=UPI0028C45BFD|nr:killer cell lectin-like receptor subfamily B member 1 [Hypanus sabinus]
MGREMDRALNLMYRTLKLISGPPRRPESGQIEVSFIFVSLSLFRTRIDKDEHSPISSGPGGRSTAAETAEPNVSYVEVNFKTPSAPRVRTDREGLKSTYSELNVRKKKPRVDEDEDPPISSGPGGLSTAAQTAAHDQQSKVKIGNRPYRLFCLLCLVTFALIVIVAGFSIHVSQIRHQFTEMETKYRSVNETKARICELLTSRRVLNCSEDWIRNNDRCYYGSTFQTNFSRAIEECSSRDSRLLEINSRDEARFVSNYLAYMNLYYWIGKCEDGNVSSGLLYQVSCGTPPCTQCDLTSLGRTYPCDVDQRFICEKSAHLFPHIPENIQGLCQQPVEAT